MRYNIAHGQDRSIFNEARSGAKGAASTSGDCGRAKSDELHRARAGEARRGGEKEKVIATIDLTGMRFGRLSVVRRQGKRSGQALWLCQCDCGNEKLVVGYTLRGGMTLSCGCLQKERASEAKTTHGKTRSSAYNTWQLMLYRCADERCRAFKDYGGRGITVCERWRKFENFYADMGDPPNGKTLDREDNSRGYSPDNCRWATAAEQAVNKRSNVFIEFKGERLCASHWAKRLGLSRRTITKRFAAGLSSEKCLAPATRHGPGWRRKNKQPLD